MFSSRDSIVTAIEFGTSKIGVLVGAVNENGDVEVIGRGEAPALSSVVKGEIVDMEKAFEQFGKALEEADRSSGRVLGSSLLVAVAVTGCGIDSQPGIGTVFIKNDERIVTEAEQNEAHENARVLNLAADREIISSSASYFLIDGRRVSNPLRHKGSRLEAHMHIIHGISSRIDNFRTMGRDAGFDDSAVEVVFSPVADDIGVLNDLDRSDGVLLIDLGAGCTEYIVEYDRGIITSGVLQIGMEHIANDLSVGLKLSMATCRKLLRSGDLARAIAERRETLEFHTGSGTGAARSIPLASFETVVDLRLRELFGIIRSRLEKAGVPHSLAAGGVLTGGGSLFPRAQELFKETFDLSCRVAQPSDAGGAVTDLESPCCSTLWGTLKIAAYYAGQGLGRKGGSLGRGRNLADNMADLVKKLSRALKF